jgi:hypothetical protein
MLVDSHELQRAVSRRHPGRDAAGVDDAGVTGLGPAGPMRKVLGIDKPFRAPGDFRGAVIGASGSTLAKATFEALERVEPQASGGGLIGLDAWTCSCARSPGTTTTPRPSTSPRT